MMFKAATVIAVATALLSSAQAAAVNAKSPLMARQNDLCPQNGESCGFFLLNSAQNAPCMLFSITAPAYPLGSLAPHHQSRRGLSVSSQDSLTRPLPRHRDDRARPPVFDPGRQHLQLHLHHCQRRADRVGPRLHRERRLLQVGREPVPCVLQQRVKGSNCFAWEGGV